MSGLFPNDPPLVETRKCNYCKRDLPLSSFWADASCKRTQCRDCAKLYLIGQKEARNLAGNPKAPPLGTSCNLCGNFKGKRLAFDHDHKTLKFRGWLCDPCNRALGILEKSLNSDLKSIALKIIKYEVQYVRT